MIEKTIVSNGKNEFKNYIYSPSDWSAPRMVSAEEIRNRLNEMKLVGRKIKELKIFGHIYNHTRERIEDFAYEALPDNMVEEKRQYESSYDNICPALELPRYVQIDEPVLIKFEDGNIFEIDVPQEPEYRFSINCIPWSIESWKGSPNADANIILNSALDKKIIDVSVDTYVSDKDPMLHCPFDDNETKREMVSRIVFWLEDHIGLSISGWIDFCEVACIDRNNKILPITFEELKPSLRNWEDVHIDSAVGFEAHSSSLCFGKNGERYVEAPYMTLVPSNADTALHIEVDDFDLFAWSITNILGKQFDEYDNYEFDYSQWSDILNEAGKIVSFDNFDELFDYMTTISECGLRYMNYAGANFWKHKQWYLTQYEDVRKWSELALKPGGKMKIYGF